MSRRILLAENPKNSEALLQIDGRISLTQSNRLPKTKSKNFGLKQNNRFYTNKVIIKILTYVSNQK